MKIDLYDGEDKNRHILKNVMKVQNIFDLDM